MKKIMCILISPLLLSACQTMTVSECQTANWSALGSQDALKGYASRAESRQDSCSKQGVNIPTTLIQQYQQAYAQSIQQYCQPENIFNLSLTGSGSISACPEPNHTKLKPYHQVASNYYQTQQSIKYTKQDIDRLDDQLIKEEDKAKKEKLMQDRISKSRELERYYDELKQAQVQLDALKNSLH
ncbi:DUF2799 domain-containing protein [Acinetobacter puyangensis]|uniref:DUF2799 domain-containing protein n=1 Tax=Acinetobacter puyangensis TaxID=1096779 RepID=A0A240EAM7_9GAMM|nr:DUF2799 domain-containing protein [Acinetobacter puyangensis]SNX44975.1 Protein of unknown function [Acinetobacter puyangensis]